MAGGGLIRGRSVVSKDWAKWKGSGPSPGHWKEWGGEQGGPQGRVEEARLGVSGAGTQQQVAQEDGTWPCLALRQELGSALLEKLGSPVSRGV